MKVTLVLSRNTRQQSAGMYFGSLHNFFEPRVSAEVLIYEALKSKLCHSVSVQVQKATATFPLSLGLAVVLMQQRLWLCCCWHGLSLLCISAQISAGKVRKKTARIWRILQNTALCKSFRSVWKNAVKLKKKQFIHIQYHQRGCLILSDLKRAASVTKNYVQRK